VTQSGGVSDILFVFCCFININVSRFIRLLSF